MTEQIASCAGPWSIGGLKRAVEIERLIAFAAGMSAAARDRLAAAPARRPCATAPEGVAVIPIAGVLLDDAPTWAQSLGFASCADLAEALRRASSDRRVRRVVLVVDSPGGAVDGVLELADGVRRAAATKPVSAVIESVAEGGAYCVCLPASEVIATPQAAVMLPGAPLARLDAPAATSAHLEGLHRALVDQVVRWRGGPLEALETLGGLTMRASTARSAGLVDRVATLAAVLAERGGPTVH